MTTETAPPTDAPAAAIPGDSADGINRRILAVAEDRINGFRARPFLAIAEACDLPEALVIERLRAMLASGTIRRVRQTLLSTSLADGALIAWKLPESRLEAAYARLRDDDPFTGHVVLRESESPDAPGSDYRLWTTLKVPAGYGTVESHCRLLAELIGAEDFAPLPVVGMFALGVGHVRRAGLKPGDKLDEPPIMQRPARPQLSRQEWQVLLALKESLEPDEFVSEPWIGRAQAIGMEPEAFIRTAEELDRRRVIGRFATFLDHTDKRNRHAGGTGASGLFHWAVPEGFEERAGAECGRHICMTHCYWRSGGERFGGAQIMGVVHSRSREGVLEHKAAIDAHLAACGIPVLHTAVFWSLRAEIRPSEIDPRIYTRWLAAHGG